MSVKVIENYDHLPPIPFVYGLSIIVLSLIFFAILNFYVKRLSPASTGEYDETWKWRNLFISWIHALIVGTWDLSSFYYYPELTTDLIAFNNVYIYALVAFSTGYFFYDFIDIAASGKIGKMWEVVPHHVAVAGMFFYNVVESRCVAYNVVALLAEVNTIFLHSRKLLQMHKWPFDHWLYRVNSAMNLFTFVSCRFLGITWIVYGMFVYYDRVSTAYLSVLASAMFVMWVTNLLLFWRLVQSDIIRPLYGSAKKPRLDHSSSSNERIVLKDEDVCVKDKDSFGDKKSLSEINDRVISRTHSNRTSDSPRSNETDVSKVLNTTNEIISDAKVLATAKEGAADGNEIDSDENGVHVKNRMNTRNAELRHRTGPSGDENEDDGDRCDVPSQNQSTGNYHNVVNGSVAGTNSLPQLQGRSYNKKELYSKPREINGYSVGAKYNNLEKQKCNCLLDSKDPDSSRTVLNGNCDGHHDSQAVRQRDMKFRDGLLGH